MKNNSRTKSQVSIQEPNPIEITKAKKILSREHPLYSEDLSSWINIPDCLQSAI
jgi:hypothetical protein